MRHLLALDAANVMHRLEARQHEMVSLFSRLRTREPMLQVVHSWFTTAGFGELAKLEPHEQRAVNAFHAELGELRWYLQYTEDMPSTVRTTLALHVKQLEAAHRALSQTIGTPDDEGHPIISVASKRK